jgi:hypothetical protein
MPDRAPTPTPERKPAWRAACLAYREKRGAGVWEHEAHLAAVAALQAVWPGLTQKEASAEVVNAISYASTYHGEWLWRAGGRWLSAGTITLALCPSRPAPRLLASERTR